MRKNFKNYSFHKNNTNGYASDNTGIRKYGTRNIAKGNDKWQWQSCTIKGEYLQSYNTAQFSYYRHIMVLSTLYIEEPKGSQEECILQDMQKYKISIERKPMLQSGPKKHKDKPNE